MHVRAVPGAETFADEAMAFLRERAGRNNLPISILSRALAGVYPESRHWIAVRGGEVVGAALQTPPHPVIVAEPAVPEAVDALGAAVRTEGGSVSGVVANVPWAERFASAWGGRWRTGMDQGVYELTEMTAPRGADGSGRPATAADRELVLRWVEEFEEEALREHHVRDHERMRLLVDIALGPDAGSGYALWEVDGEPVSLTGFGRYAFGARVGPVYTPPAHRGRGFASNLVAHISASMLSSGVDACYLYTDLANPTSNRIYTDVGYRMIARSQELVFDP